MSTVRRPPNDGAAGEVSRGRVVAGPSAKSGRCRCGTWLEVGSSTTTIEGAPAALEPLLRGQVFCGALCVRAYLLEALEVLQNTAAPETLSDFHELYSGLQTAFALADLAVR